MLTSPQSPGALVGTISFLLALNILVVMLRYQARKIKRLRLMADDWLCFVSLLLTSGLAIVIFVGVAQKCLAYPNYQGKYDGIWVPVFFTYIFLVISVPTLGAIKLSILFFYRRLFVVDKSNVKDPLNIVYVGLITVVTLWIVGFCLAFIFMCKDHPSTWFIPSLSLPNQCVNTDELLVVYAISDFVVDVIIIFLPIPSVVVLHLPTHRKIGLLLVFLLGTLAIVASLIRMIWVVRDSHVALAFLNIDNLFTAYLFWFMLEMTLGIIACCLPTLRPLLQHKFMAWFQQSVQNKISFRSRKSVSNHDVPLRRLTNQGSKASQQTPLVPGSQYNWIDLASGAE